MQFTIQLVGTSAFISYFGPTVSMMSVCCVRLTAAAVISYLQAGKGRPECDWYYRLPQTQVQTVMWFDAAARMTNLTVSKVSKETMWATVPKDVKYRAKIVIDVFAYRLRTSLAAILGDLPIVSLFPAFAGVEDHMVCGLMMCVVWIYCSYVLGEEIRRSGESRKRSKELKPSDAKE